MSFRTADHLNSLCRRAQYRGTVFGRSYATETLGSKFRFKWSYVPKVRSFYIRVRPCFVSSHDPSQILHGLFLATKKCVRVSNSQAQPKVTTLMRGDLSWQLSTLVRILIAKLKFLTCWQLGHLKEYIRYLCKSVEVWQMTEWTTASSMRSCQNVEFFTHFAAWGQAPGGTCDQPWR